MTHSVSLDSGFVLLIERGQTRFPERPIDVDRFLIGGGSNCHLQLGGHIPILHSIIIPEGDHLWIDAVVPVPALVINGQTVRESELWQGDVVEIDGFVFSVGYKHPAIAAAAAAQTAVDANSALELVNALEEELSQLAALESARAEGATALLQAAAMVAQSGDAAPQPMQLPSHWDQAVAGLLDELRTRAQDLDLRESELAKYARQLDQTQQELQRQLDHVCEQIQAKGDQQDAAPLRLTA